MRPPKFPALKSPGSASSITASTIDETCAGEIQASSQFLSSPSQTFNPMTPPRHRQGHGSSGFKSNRASKVSLGETMYEDSDEQTKIIANTVYASSSSSSSSSSMSSISSSNNNKSTKHKKNGALTTTIRTDFNHVFERPLMDPSLLIGKKKSLDLHLQCCADLSREGAALPSSLIPSQFMSLQSSLLLGFYDLAPIHVDIPRSQIALAASQLVLPCVITNGNGREEASAKDSMVTPSNGQHLRSLPQQTSVLPAALYFEYEHILRTYSAAQLHCDDFLRLSLNNFARLLELVQSVRGSLVPALRGYSPSLEACLPRNAWTDEDVTEEPLFTCLQSIFSNKTQVSTKRKITQEDEADNNVLLCTPSKKSKPSVTYTEDMRSCAQLLSQCSATAQCCSCLQYCLQSAPELAHYSALLVPGGEALRRRNRNLMAGHCETGALVDTVQLEDPLLQVGQAVTFREEEVVPSMDLVPYDLRAPLLSALDSTSNMMMPGCSNGHLVCSSCLYYDYRALQVCSMIVRLLQDGVNAASQLQLLTNAETCIASLARLLDYILTKQTTSRQVRRSTSSIEQHTGVDVSLLCSKSNVSKTASALVLAAYSCSCGEFRGSNTSFYMHVPPQTQFNTTCTPRRIVISNKHASISTLPKPFSVHADLLASVPQELLIALVDSPLLLLPCVFPSFLPTLSNLLSARTAIELPVLRPQSSFVEIPARLTAPMNDPYLEMLLPQTEEGTITLVDAKMKQAVENAEFQILQSDFGTNIVCPSCNSCFQVDSVPTTSTMLSPVELCFNTHRFKCPKCGPFCAQCRAKPYHIGYTCQSYASYLTMLKCRYCESIMTQDELSFSFTQLSCMGLVHLLVFPEEDATPRCFLTDGTNEEPTEATLASLLEFNFATINQSSWTSPGQFVMVDSDMVDQNMSDGVREGSEVITFGSVQTPQQPAMQLLYYDTVLFAEHVEPQRNPVYRLTNTLFQSSEPVDLPLLIKSLTVYIEEFIILYQQLLIADKSWTGCYPAELVKDAYLFSRTVAARGALQLACMQESLYHTQSHEYHQNLCDVKEVNPAVADEHKEALAVLLQKGDNGDEDAESVQLSEAHHPIPPKTVLNVLVPAIKLPSILRDLVQRTCNRPVCDKPECKLRLQDACQYVHPCGHPCVGIRREAVHPPCGHKQCNQALKLLSNLPRETELMNTRTHLGSLLSSYTSNFVVVCSASVSSLYISLFSAQLGISKADIRKFLPSVRFNRESGRSLLSLLLALYDHILMNSKLNPKLPSLSDSKIPLLSPYASVRPDVDYSHSTFCTLCYVDTVDAAPSVVLSCSHVIHLTCQYQRLLNKWSSSNVDFTYLTCPTCHADLNPISITLSPSNTMDGGTAQNAVILHRQAQHVLAIRSHQAQVAEGVKEFPQLQDKSSEFFQQPIALALHTFAFTQCFQCRGLYSTGRKACLPADSVNRRTLLCEYCRPNKAMPTTCNIHGTVSMQFKCKFCCSPASWFCWGTTHFCNACHALQNVGNFVSKASILELPQCKDALEYERMYNNNANIIKAIKELKQGKCKRKKMNIEVTDQDIREAYNNITVTTSCKHGEACALKRYHALNGISCCMGCLECQK